MNRSNLPWFIVAALTLVVILLIMFGGERRSLDPDKKAFEDTVNVLKSKVWATVLQQEEIIKRVTESKAKDSVALEAFKIENRRLKTKIASIRPRVVQVLIDNPSVDSLVKALDTLNQHLERENSRLQYSLQIQGKEFVDLTVAHEEERRISERMITETLARVEVLERERKKAKKQSRLIKAIGVLGVGLALVLGAQI